MSAARFFHQVVAWVTDMQCNSYLVKIHTIDNNIRTTKAREKISTDLESYEFKKKIYVCLTKFKNNQIFN